jgi:hypothetical protein
VTVDDPILPAAIHIVGLRPTARRFVVENNHAADTEIGSA